MNVRTGMLRVVSAFCPAIYLLVQPCAAQTNAALDIALYAGLTITGSIGSVYSIECTPNLTQSNTWQCLEFLQLPASPYVWTDRSTAVTTQRFYRAIEMAPSNMVYIPPGTYRMGSPDNEPDRYTHEGPQTIVTISKGYFIGKYEVTQADYISVMGMNPSYFTNNMDNPVDQVLYADAMDYCSVRTQQERQAGLIAGNCGYRLPTEAEWEYACRAWTSTRYSYGDDTDYSDLANYAWAGLPDDGTGTHAVGQKLPNPWGLYDMHGNAWEWVSDWWADSLPGGSLVDPTGPETGTVRVRRGGDWDRPKPDSRSASRDYWDPAAPYTDISFRPVLAPDVD